MHENVENSLVAVVIVELLPISLISCLIFLKNSLLSISRACACTVFNVETVIIKGAIIVFVFVFF